jgi:outer membrane protein OmpA-like peptidoglycan-associated protein
MVTAEPHFAVTAPSQAVVLQNFGKDVRGQSFNIEGLKQRIDYSQLAPQARDEKHDVPSDLVQARYAVAIADAADAGKFASAEYQKAQGLLAQAEAAETGKGGSRRDVPEISRSAVQSAEDARRRAVEGAAAEQAKQQAAARAAQAAAQAATAQAAAGERQAQQAAEESAALARRAAREDLVERLNRVLPTTETDRGIVAEISGVQFATGKAALNPDARESLAKFAGIVGVYPGMKFRVEGHTDSTGGYELNRELSLKRASSVRDYLVGQGVPNSRIDVEGLGPDRPVASNETKEGRARNRRVEIILEGDPVAGP